MSPRWWWPGRPLGTLATVLLLAGTLAGLAANAPLVRAATITITSTSTTVNPTDGLCTLIEAIIAANTDTASGPTAGECPAGSGADTILLATGAIYTLTAVHNDTDGPNGLPTITTAITLVGDGSIIERSSAPGTPAFRLLRVGFNARLTLRGLTVRNGLAASGTNGGGIYNSGLLVIDAVSLANNATIGGDGGGLFNDFVGTARLSLATVTGNAAGSNPPGLFGGSGGGIANVHGLLVIERSIIAVNRTGDGSAVGGSGGGIHNLHGRLTLTDSVVRGNTTGNGSSSSGGVGGGLATLSIPNSAEVINSVISGNTTGSGGQQGGSGGGIYQGNGTLVVTNSTISGNETGGATATALAGFGGGLASNTGDVTLRGSTISANRAGGTTSLGFGGGLDIIGSPLTLTNTIVAGNQASGYVTGDSADCHLLLLGSALSASYNLVGMGTGCPSSGPGDQTVSPAAIFTTVLGPLAANGGTTGPTGEPLFTHALLAGSPAIDRGNPATPGSSLTACPTTDQRGVARPQGARCDIGAYEGGVVLTTLGARLWYFAEGYTGPGFDEYLTIQNPNGVAADVTITYYLTGAQPITKSFTVPANSRDTVAVHDTTRGVGRNQAVAAKVESTTDIIVERPMYFTYTGSTSGITGGHNVMGVQAPRTSWLFAEGYTGPGFDEYLTILNPHDSPAPVTITYYLGGGQAPVIHDLMVPHRSRATVAVHDTALGVGRDQAVSAKVETSLTAGIVVERPIYFRYTGSMGRVTGGHNVMGAAEPQPVWHFPDGNTVPGYDTYLTLMNPFATVAQVRLTYYVVGETAPRTKDISVPGTSRATVLVHDDHEGVGRGKTLGITVETRNGVNLVVERPVYFQYSPSVNGGLDVLGASEPGPIWLFAEGYTGTGFDEYLVVLNPTSTAADVTITYYLTSGGPLTRALTVSPFARAMVAVHESGQVGRGQAVSAKVASTNGVNIVVERPIYFNYTGSTMADGGHTVMGYRP